MGSDELHGITCCAKIVHEDLHNLMFHTSHVQYEQNRNQNMETRNIRLDSPS